MTYEQGDTPPRDDTPSGYEPEQEAWLQFWYGFHCGNDRRDIAEIYRNGHSFYPWTRFCEKGYRVGRAQFEQAVSALNAMRERGVSVEDVNRKVGP